MELAGVGLTFWLTWSSIGWLKVTINGFPFTLSAWSVAPATLKPLIFHRGSWGCIRGWLFLRPGKAAKTEAVERSGESRTKRKQRKGKWEMRKEPTLVIIYLSYLHATLTCFSSCDMNLDSTCMEIKCLKAKYILNQNLQFAPVVWINI